MKTRDMMETLLNASPVLGTFSAQDLFRVAKKDCMSGIAAAKGEESDLFLALLDGEVEGAIYIDGNGDLFGDNAARRFSGKEIFSLYDVKKDLIDAVVMGCRVFEKSHLKPAMNYELPQFGTRSSGIGNLTLIIHQNHEPQNGIRVSIRKDGKIVGSDFTTHDGSVSFRAMHGIYECVLQDRNQMITTRRIDFKDADVKMVLDL